jgi:hypothetical protein
MLKLLKVSHSHHACNFWCKTIFYIYYVDMFLIYLYQVPYVLLHCFISYHQETESYKVFTWLPWHHFTFYKYYLDRFCTFLKNLLPIHHFKSIKQVSAVLIWFHKLLCPPCSLITDCNIHTKYRKNWSSGLRAERMSYIESIVIS